MKFAVFTKTDKDVSKEVNSVLKECDRYGFIKDEDNPEIVFVLGGDGTFLKAIHHYVDKLESIKFIGFRCGTLGFFYDYSKDDIPVVIKNILDEKYIVKSHNLLEFLAGDKIIYAVNEIGVAHTFHSLECLVKINGEAFEQYNGNGLLVSSPLGSTGYNKSLGGAIISHDLETIQLTEISSIHNNLYNSLGSSLILGKDSIITFEGDFKGAKIGYDHWSYNCDDEKIIEIKYSDRKVSIIHGADYNYLNPVKRSFIK